MTVSKSAGDNLFWKKGSYPTPFPKDFRGVLRTRLPKGRLLACALVVVSLCAPGWGSPEFALSPDSVSFFPLNIAGLNLKSDRNNVK